MNDALASVFGASEPEPSYIASVFGASPPPPPPPIYFSTSAIATLCVLAATALLVWCCAAPRRKAFKKQHIGKGSLLTSREFVREALARRAPRGMLLHQRAGEWLQLAGLVARLVLGAPAQALVVAVLGLGRRAHDL